MTIIFTSDTWLLRLLGVILTILIGTVTATARRNDDVVINQAQATNADIITGLDFTTFRFNTTDISSRLILYPNLTTGRMRMQATSDMRIKIEAMVLFL